MYEVSAAAVKELREKTGSGMMDCKKALIECQGSMADATDWLRKKGLAAAGKRAERVASEGVVVIASEGSKAVVLELNSETDFVSKNDKFQNLARSLADLALQHEVRSVEELLSLRSPLSDNSVQEEIVEHIAVIGENIALRRLELLSVPQGVIGSYVHAAVGAGMGKIGVLVAIESDAKSDKIAEFARGLAMHIAAAAPKVLEIAELDSALVEKERQIAKEQAVASGKPAAVVEKMVEGRVAKFYEEVVLLNQQYVLEGKNKVSEVASNLAQKAGSAVRICGFVRYALGEGVEKKQNDFAAEVAVMAG